jgi:hypothetical protein
MIENMSDNHFFIQISTKRAEAGKRGGWERKRYLTQKGA